MPIKNPHLYQPKYGRMYNPKSPGENFFVGVVGHRGTRKFFKTKTDAKQYAERIVIRWRRLYDA